MSQENSGKVCASENSRDPKGHAASRRLRLIVIGLVFSLAIFGTFQIARTADESAKDRQAVVSSPADPPVAVSGIFTPAHQSLFGAVKEFLLWQSAPVQPIAFNHRIHIQHGMQCVSCHSGATQGPDAGIPSANFCMACHQVIAADNPQIKKLAAYAAKGQDVPWQGVFWFYPSEHVQFWHAPHVRAAISCGQCHGDIAQETVAVRTKDLNMKFCLSCHIARHVSIDCTTCHY